MMCANFIDSTKGALKVFYKNNPQIKESHGLSHVLAVHAHSSKAIECISPPLSPDTSMEIQLASLLHDVDDHKYFPDPHQDSQNDDTDTDAEYRLYPNATHIMSSLGGLPPRSCTRILRMISWVSCSSNGNSVPPSIQACSHYHLLIPRWSDRLEAIGARGVVRSYRYNREHALPLSSPSSPRASDVEEVWKLAPPERFELYQASGGESEDMISHYYDKLLHVAKPPQDSVRNGYLERMGRESADALIEVCLRFGRTGLVDIGYIEGLADELEKGGSG